MSTSSKIKFAIIGTGSITQLHKQAIDEIENAELVALCSTSPERAAQIQESMNLPCYSDLEQLFKEQDIDAISICTFSGNHLPACEEAAKRGIHVITEKPLEVSLERADAMINICKENNVLLACIFQSRFKPDYIRLKEAIADGLLGKIIHGNAYINWFRNEDYYQSSSWRGSLEGDGGAALINQGIHTIDLLLDVMGSVENVFGQVRTTVHNIEGEDLGMAILNFENGSTGTIQGSTAMYPGYPERLEIYGSDGSIILEGGNIVAFNSKNKETESTTKSQSGSGASDPMSISYLYHKIQLQDFVDAILSGKEPLISGEDGRPALAVIQAIYKSSKANKLVELSSL